MSHDDVVEYFKATTPAEVAKCVVDAMDYYDCLIVAQFVTARAKFQKAPK